MCIYIYIHIYIIYIYIYTYIHSCCMLSRPFRPLPCPRLAALPPRRFGAALVAKG